MANALQVSFLIAGKIGNSNSANYDGLPLAGGKVYFYDVGTTDLATVYTVADKTTASVNPVILSTEGTAEVFFDGSCDIKIDDADDVTIETLNDQFFTVSTGTTMTVTSISANHTSTTTNTVLVANSTSGNITVTLQTAASITGEQIVIKKTVAANTVTIDGLSSETIDGLTTRVLHRQHEFIRIMSDGTNWRIIATGVNYLPDGTAALPALYSENNTTTGFFFGTDITGVTTAGVEAFRVDASQRVLTGHTSAITAGGSSTAAQLQHSGTGLDTASQLSVLFNNGTTGLKHIISKSRAASATAFASTPVTVVTGDIIAEHQYTADDGTDLINMVAQVEVKVEGTIAGNRTPGAYIISTATDGAPSVLTEAFRLDSSQNATFAGGVDIAASNNYTISGTTVIADSSGTATLSNIDALDATTEATIEAAMDTLPNVTSVGTLTNLAISGTGLIVSSSSVIDFASTNTGAEGGARVAHTTDTTGLQVVNVQRALATTTTVALAKGIRIAPLVAASATITDWRALSIENNAGAGTISTSYLALIDTDFFTTGGNTPTMGTNCPGTAGGPDQWIRVKVGATTGWIPVWT